MPSKRGVGVAFGQDITERFLKVFFFFFFFFFFFLTPVALSCAREPAESMEVQFRTGAHARTQ